MFKFTIKKAAGLMLLVPLAALASLPSIQQRLLPEAPATPEAAETTPLPASVDYTDVVEKAYASAREGNPQLVDARQADVKLGETRGFDFDGTTWKRGNVAPVAPGELAKAPLRANALNQGYYIYKDYPVSNPGAFTTGAIELRQRNDSVFMYNMDRRGFEVYLTENETHWTIPAQKLTTHETYGEIWMVPINTQNGTFDLNGEITVVVNTKGKAQLSPWAILIPSGKYEGQAFCAYAKSEWFVSNASTKVTDINGEVYHYPMLVEQLYSNRLNFYNMVGQGEMLEVAITPSKNLRITRQFILANMMLGNAYCYAADWTTKKLNTEADITGRATAAGFELDDWAVAFSGDMTVALAADKTEITSGFAVEWPEPTGGSFEGAGTQSSPYLIKSADDLYRLSEQTSAGDTFKGKYFSMAGDVSLAGGSRAWDPIGDATCKFEGSFDGKNHSVKGLTSHGRGARYFGLFGYLGSSARVENLSLADATLAGSGDNVGGIAAWNDGTISACSFAGSLTGSGNETGAIAAVNAGTITDCSVDGTIGGAGNVGSISAQCYGLIADCHSKATVSTTGYFSSVYRCVGGITGMISPLRTASGDLTPAMVRDCYYEGGISDRIGFAAVGGITGGMVMGNMERCMNVGLVTARRVNPDGDTATGGVAGTANESVVHDCLNAGTVIKNETSEYVGGIIGWVSCSYIGTEVSGPNDIRNCLNTGYVLSTSSAPYKGVYGSTFELNGINPIDQMMTNCLFDAQMNGLKDTKYGRRSADLTAGTLPQGFSADAWTAAAGRYPVLKKFEKTDAGRLAAAFMQLDAAEDSRKVKKSISLKSDSPVSWSLLKDSELVTSTAALTLSGTTLTVGKDYGNETVVASLPGGTMRAFYVAVVPKAFEGQGTEQSPYLIIDKTDFQTLHRAVAQFGQAHEGDFFRMTDDIDFGLAGDFAGIGHATSRAFGGTFDGDGHTISRFKSGCVNYNAGTAVADGSCLYGGLFSVLSKEATVKNITFAADCKFDFWGYSGPVAGINAGRIENCRNYAPVSGIAQYIGGIAGASSGTIEGCYNSGRVHAGLEYVGGITGQNNGTITLCQNDGDILADDLNDAVKATATKSGAGGIAGFNYGAVDRCANLGTVAAWRFTGGIVGSNSNSYGTNAITRCVNSGLVECLTDADTRGGIIGNNLSKGNLADTYFDFSICPFGAANSLGVSGLNSLYTYALTAGKTLEGLDAADWDFTEGVYPVLKRFASEKAAAAMRSIFPRFADKQVRTNLIDAVELSAPQGIAWSLKGSDNFSIADGKLNVVQPTELVVAVDTLTATLGSYRKVYEVKSIPNVLEGRGFESDPFLIRTVDDFNKLSDFIQSSRMDYNGFFFRVENDIDFTGKELHPIATGKLKFQADFDGNGKTFKGIKYSDTSSTDGKGRYVGIFGTLGEASRVHDLTVDGSFEVNGYSGVFAGNLYGTISGCVNRASITATGTSYVAGFAGTAYEGSNLTDCVNYGAITAKGKSYAAGIVGDGRLTNITGCRNEGHITANGFIGGIAARVCGTITDCYNKGELTATSTGAYAGGIAAQGNLLGTLTLTRCHNDVDLTMSGNYAAGILARADGGTTKNGVYTPGCFVTLEDCYNTANIKVNAYGAGLAYSLDGGVMATNCYNTGSLTATGTGSLGGLFGNLGCDPTRDNIVTECWNEGKLVSSGRNNGGFAVGSTAGVRIERCYNIGDVTTSYVGTSSNQAFTAGFISYHNGHAYRCWNSGNVTSSQFAVSGFSSYGSGTLESCVNLGNVTMTGTVVPTNNFGGAAAFWNQGQNSTLYCANFGTIKSTLQTCGLHSAAWNGATVIGCYNAGDVVVTGSDKTRCDVLVSRRTILEGTTTISNNYYSTDALTDKAIPNSQNGVGMTDRELRSARMGESFVYDRAALPTVPGLFKPARVHFAAAAYDFNKADDHEGNVTSYLWLPALEELNWSVDNGAVIDGGRVYTTNLGMTRLTCTAEPGLEKHFDFMVTKVSSVDEIDAGREVVAREYYDLAGRRLAEPQRAAVTVVVSHYSDGTVETRRVLLAD